jgi:hypothetical protein
VFLYWHSFSGHVPIVGDHLNHLFKALQLKNEFLSEGQLWGWSHKMFTGYPAQYLYPVGGDLWVNFVYVASLGLLSFQAAYGLAFGLTWLLTALALYYVGVLYFNRSIGFLASLFLLVDISHHRLGGFAHVSYLGVWPQQLSVAFGLLAVAQLPAILKNRDTKGIGLFALFAGISMICHPAELVHFGLFGLALCLSFALKRDFKKWLEANVAVICALLIAGLIASAWYLPFILTSDFSANMGHPWVSTWRIGQRLFSAGILPGTWPVIVLMGIFGIISLMRSEDILGYLVAVMTVICFMSTAIDLHTQLHLYELAESFQFIEYPRLSYFLKPYFFLASGFTIYLVCVSVFENTSWRRVVGSDLQSSLAIGLAVIVAIPLAIPFAEKFHSSLLNRELKPWSETKILKEAEKVASWLESEHQKDEFFRIGTAPERKNQWLTSLAILIDRPIYKFGFTPASNYEFKLMDSSIESLRQLSIRYVVSTEKLEREHFEEVKKYEELFVYKVDGVSETPLEVTGGEADLDLLEFDNEKIKIRASSVSGEAPQIKLNVSYFPRWKAYRDGEPLDIDMVSEGERFEQSGFMRVPLQNGSYVFKFERGWPEIIAPFPLFLGLLIALYLIVVPGNRLRIWIEALVERIQAGTPRSLRTYYPALLLLVISSILVTLALWRPPIKSPEDTPTADIDVAYDFGERLGDARVGVAIDDEDKIESCFQVFSRHLCGRSERMHVRQLSTYFGDKYLHRCVSATARAKGDLVLHYPVLPEGDRLLGYGGVPTKEGGELEKPLEVELDLPGERDKKLSIEEAGRLSWFEIPFEFNSESAPFITVRVQQREKSQQPFCFLAQVQNISAE